MTTTMARTTVASVVDATQHSSLAHLPGQLAEVLRSNTMTLQQLTTYYAIKYKFSLAVRVRDAQAGTLKEYLGQFSDVFEVEGEKVRMRVKTPAEEKVSEEVVQPSEQLATIRYAHISRGLQSLLNETADGSMNIASLESVFRARYGVSLLSIIGMPTVEYLQRKANVFSIEGETVHLQPAFLKAVAEAKQAEKPAVKAFEPERGSTGINWADASEESIPSSISTQSTSQRPHAQVTVPCEPEAKLGGSGSGATSKATCATHTPGDAFVVSELEKIFEDHTEGPIMHSSVLCSLFMQRHGESVSAVSGVKPMELFRRNQASFLWLSSGNVALAKYKEDRAVQHELRLLNEQPKCVRVKAAAAEAALPVPESVSEQDVVDYLRTLLLENVDRESIYISALCGRFMQRFRRPVTEVVGCKPTDFIKRYSNIFYLEKGGHVRFVDLEGEKARAATGNSQNPSTDTERSGSLSPVAALRTKVSTVPPAVVATMRSERRKAMEQQSFSPQMTAPKPATPCGPMSAGLVEPPWRRAVEQQKQATSKPHCNPLTLASPGAPIIPAAPRMPLGMDQATQQAEEFCNRLRTCLFFKAKVTLGAVRTTPDEQSATPSALQAEVAVAVRDLPSQLHSTWLPQLLKGLHEVAALRLADQVDCLALRGDGLKMRLQGEHPVDLFVRVVALAE